MYHHYQLYISILYYTLLYSICKVYFGFFVKYTFIFKVYFKFPSLINIPNLKVYFV